MSHVVPDLVQKVLKGQDPLHILGTGHQVRHYTYGGDLARGILTRSKTPRRQRGLQPVHPGVDDRSRAGELIWSKIKGPNQPFRYVRDPAFEHDVQKRMPEVGKARRMLGFEATTGLSEMLDEVIPWIDQAIKDGSI